MNKSELIAHIAVNADLSKASAERALDATMEAIHQSLKNGEAVSLIGFGTFGVTERAARNGRNPRTGEALTIKASKVPKFTASQVLKDALN